MRRLKANASALRRLLEDGVTVQSVSEDLYCVTPEEVGPALGVDLASRGFDRCGLRDTDRIVRYVERAALDTHPGAASPLPIQADRLVAETASLWAVMPRLARAQWMFVLTPTGPDSIVTVADLAKQPARLLMFGILSLLEMTMLSLVRSLDPGDGWQSMLSEDRVVKAKELLAQRRSKDQEIDLADCLQWCDKAAICAKTEPVRERWQLSKTKCDGLLGHAQRLRDLLAHAQHPAPDGDWEHVVSLLQESDRLTVHNMELLEDAELEVASAR